MVLGRGKEKSLRSERLVEGFGKSFALTSEVEKGSPARLGWSSSSYGKKVEKRRKNKKGLLLKNIAARKRGA